MLCTQIFNIYIHLQELALIPVFYSPRTDYYLRHWTPKRVLFSFNQFGYYLRKASSTGGCKTRPKQYLADCPRYVVKHLHWMAAGWHSTARHSSAQLPLCAHLALPKAGSPVGSRQLRGEHVGQGGVHSKEHHFKQCIFSLRKPSNAQNQAGNISIWHICRVSHGQKLDRIMDKWYGAFFAFRAQTFFLYGLIWRKTQAWTNIRCPMKQSKGEVFQFNNWV